MENESPARVETRSGHRTFSPSQGYPLSSYLDFSFSRPPEPELGGGLTHPTTEGNLSRGRPPVGKGFA